MKKKILIIDDEVDFCLIMKGYFMKRGHDVSIAHTLKEGLALFKEVRPEILFIDNNLPDGNGWDAVPAAVEIIPQIRAYLVSAHRNNSPFVQAKENVTIWEKPISLTMLETIL
jgi:DNA-binding NtrC family response regulator